MGIIIGAKVTLWKFIVIVQPFKSVKKQNKAWFALFFITLDYGEMVNLPLATSNSHLE